MSQQNLQVACAHSCLLCPWPDANSWQSLHPSSSDSCPGQPQGPPSSPACSSLHLLLLQFTPTVSPKSCFPPESNLDVTTNQVHLPQHWRRFGLNSDLLRWPQKVVRLWVGCRAQGVPKSRATETGSLSNTLGNPQAHKRAVQCHRRLWQNKSLIKITVKSLWFLLCPSHSQSSPRPLPLPGSCIHRSCTPNLWKQDPTSLPQGWLLDIVYNQGAG